MKIDKKDIGNGAHWRAVRVTTIKNGLTTSIIRKESLKNESADKNISIYQLIHMNGLPTLSEFSKQLLDDKEFILAEDLNPKNSDGIYVSPNTVRNAPSCSSIFLKKLSNPKQEVPIECKDFEFSEYVKNPKKISTDINKLNETKILRGSEKFLYENKVNKISNFNQFLIQSKDDMKKASSNNIELFSDAFFFRVSESENKIDYKIADFDCIISHQNTPMCIDTLTEGNKSYFKTAILEFIEYFVEENEREIYKNEMKNVW